jgi:single-strand DNA-binding protein
MADTATTIIGNITGDPELRYTPQGNAVVSFTIAVNSRYRDGDKWVEGDTSFFRCNAWRDLAEHIADSLGKGNRVVATGYLKQRSWEDNEGNTRSVVEIEVQDIGPSLRWAVARPDRADGKVAARPEAETTGPTKGRSGRAPTKTTNRNQRANNSVDTSQFADEPSF